VNDAMVDMICKQLSRSFILVPINFSYTTSYKLSIVTLLWDSPFSHNTRYRWWQTTDEGRNTVSATVSTVC